MSIVNREVKQHDNPSNGPWVEFYLGWPQHVDRSRPRSTTIEVNGYKFTAEFGKRNLLPKACVAVLKNATSAVLPSPNAGKVEMARGGEGRPQSEIFHNTQSVQYVPDFDIVDEKEV